MIKLPYLYGWDTIACKTLISKPRVQNRVKMNSIGWKVRIRREWAKWAMRREIREDKDLNWVMMKEKNVRGSKRIQGTDRSLWWRGECFFKLSLEWNKVKSVESASTERVQKTPWPQWRRYCKAGSYNLCPDIRFAATPPVHGSLVRSAHFEMEFLNSILSRGFWALTWVLSIFVWFSTLIFRSAKCYSWIDSSFLNLRNFCNDF